MKNIQFFIDFSEILDENLKFFEKFSGKHPRGIAIAIETPQGNRLDEA